MFEQASIYNQPLNAWDVAQVTNINFLFNSASFFNQPVGLWSVGQVRNLHHTFREATVFNQDLNAWETSGATSLNSLFKASAFNQPLNAWECADRHLNRLIYSLAACPRAVLCVQCEPGQEYEGNLQRSDRLRPDAQRVGRQPGHNP